MIGPRIGIKPVPGKQGLAIGAGEDGVAPSVLTTTMSLTLLDSADPVNGDTNFNYTSVVTNTGSNTANNVTWTLTLDASLTFVSGLGTGWTVGHSGQTITATRASLAVGAAPTITVTVTPTNADASISSSATATADNVFVAVTPATQGTTINGVTSLSVVLADLADPVMTAQNYSYTTVVTNTGSATANNVSCVIVCPTNSTFVSASGTGWTCNNSSHTVTCTRSTLAVGAAPTITVTVLSAASAETSSATADADADNTAPATQDTETTGVLLVSKDATSGKRVPNSPTEWANVGSICGFSCTPTGLWLLQEPSGPPWNFSDSSGNGFTLTESGISITYQSPETGWTRTGVRFSDATPTQAYNISTSLPDPATTSIMLMAYADLSGAAPTGAATFESVGNAGVSGAGLMRRSSGTAKAEVNFHSTTVNGTIDYLNAVVPFVVQSDVTTPKCNGYTDQEKLVVGAQALSVKIIQLGNGANVNVLYWVMFSGSVAEMTTTQIKTLLQTLGWPVSWAP